MKKIVLLRKAIENFIRRVQWKVKAVYVLLRAGRYVVIAVQDADNPNDVLVNIHYKDVDVYRLFKSLCRESTLSFSKILNMN